MAFLLWQQLIRRAQIRREKQQKLKSTKQFFVVAFSFVLCFIVASSAQLTASAIDEQSGKPDGTIQWEGQPYVTDYTSGVQTKATTGKIIDVSKWQGNINWAKVAKSTDLAIIRVQYGSAVQDYMHKTYEKGATANGVPYGVYSYMQASSSANARIEARNLINRASNNAKFYVIDVEEITSKSGESMRTIVNAYVDELRKHTDKQIGLYIAHHIYSKLNLDTKKADFVWIPRYGSTKPAYRYDLWQYTDRAVVSGISGPVDANKLAPGKKVNDFLKKSPLAKDSGITQTTNNRYYSINPRKVVLKQNVGEYRDTAFKSKVRILKKNTIVAIDDVQILSNGVPRLRLENGNYITANRANVLKVRSDIENYITDVPDRVLLRRYQMIYDSKDFTKQHEVRKYNKNTTFEVASIVYTANGTPRLKTPSGNYLSARKDITRAVPADIKKYYYVSPKQVTVAQDLNVFSTVDFKADEKLRIVRAGESLPIEGIRYTDNGVPRLKIADGQYISAYKARFK